MPGINMFAKILPYTNANGWLYKMNEDHTIYLNDNGDPELYTDANGNTLRLRTNELGIVYQTHQLIIVLKENGIDTAYFFNASN